MKVIIIGAVVLVLFAASLIAAAAPVVLEVLRETSDTH